MTTTQRILTKPQARRFMLAHQGLLANNRFVGKEGILDFVRRVGCIQFDPLNVVGFNQHLVLQSRIANFTPTMLEELLYSDRKLVDGWDKNMSIYLTEDWPYFSRLRKDALSRLENMPYVKEIVPQVINTIMMDGPRSSADLDYNQVVEWPWAPTRLSRAVLESLYFSGELIIHHKLRTRKVYDLTRNYLPNELINANDPNPTLEDYWEWYVLRRIGAIGLLWNKSGDAWLGISGLKSQERAAAINRLLDKKKIIPVQVEDIKIPLYVRAVDLPLLDETAEKDYHYPSRAFILAPLDNLMWDRKLLRELFEFEYRWEVYKPVTERQFGYYVLPVMCDDRVIARFEPVLDKKKKELIIKNWWWEPNAEKSPKNFELIRACFYDFLQFTGMNELRLELSSVSDLKWLLSLQQ